MKKYLAALLLTSSVAFAAETVLIDVPVRDLGPMTRTESKLHVDLENGQVSGILTSVLDRQVCRWEYTPVRYYHGGGPRGGYMRPMGGSRLVCFNSSEVTGQLSAVIDDLMVVNNEIIMKAESGDVVCGVLKKGRIFKNTTKIVLNGKCTVDDRVIKVDGEKRAQLILVTK